MAAPESGAGPSETDPGTPSWSIVDLRKSPGHLSTVVELCFAEWPGEIFIPQCPNPTPADLEQYLERTALAPDTWPAVLVAETPAGDLLGTVALDPEDLPDRTDLAPWLTSLVVLRAHRGRGVGSALIAAARDHARAHGFSAVHLHCDPSLTPFYDKRGFANREHAEFGGHEVVIMRGVCPLREGAAPPWRILDLRECPGHLDTVAHLVFREWPDETIACGLATEEALRAHLAATSLVAGVWTTVFVAVTVEDKVVGTVTLEEEDMPERRDLAPWLASLLVVEGHRGLGLGTALIAAARSRALLHGFDALHLHCLPRLESLYTQHNFATVESVQFCGHQVQIMRGSTAP